MKPGTQLGPYEIVGKLGEGGMGEVYRARDTRLGRDVAVKVLPLEYARDADLRARFEREARTISSLSDPHICALYDVGEAEVEAGETTSYLVMEYLRGESLSDRIAKGALPIDQVLELGAQIAGALSSAHRLGIVHRDLKPGNVMITAGGAKLLDFGLAKSIIVETAGEMPTAPITRSGAIVGTLQYMAPEQLEGREADVRTDIFSLGVVLYEMAAGKRAFSGSSPASLASAILRDEPAPLGEANSLTPRALERLVRRCMAKDPEQRWQSAADIAADLRHIRDDLSSGRAMDDGPPISGEHARQRRVPVPAILAVCALAISIAVIWTTRRFTTAPTVSPPRIEVEVLTTQPGIEWFPSLSPDGDWVVYSGLADTHQHIFLQSVGGNKAVDLTEDSTVDDDQPAFSPDGQRIAFHSSRDGGGIFVMGRTGEAVRRLTRDGYRPTWSPDGTMIAYTMENVELNPQNVEGKSALWVVGVDGGEPKRLLEFDASLASWSPHGNRIAFTSRTGNPFQADIRSVPAEGGEVVAVTDDKWTDWCPTWSPDGKFIYFASNRGGSMNLWRIRVNEVTGAASGEPEAVTVPATTATHPSLSANGARLAYTSAQVTINIQRAAIDLTTLEIGEDFEWVTTGSRQWSSPDPSPDGEWVTFYSLTQPEGDLYVARRDGTGLRLLTGDEAVDRVPRWSPSGDWIACFSTRGGPLNIWRVHPDGSSLQQVTEGGGSIVAWSPDSTHIAIVNGINHETVIVEPNVPRGEQKLDHLPHLEKDGMRFISNSWSPDGRRLAGSLGLGKDAKGVVVFDFDSREYEALTDFGEWPIWLPDSRHLLFVARGDGFYVVDTSSKEVRRIYTSTSDIIGPPRLSAKGELFYSRRVTETEIWLAALD